jgi:ubiquinone/menaquinone biosynthesis C-methylase UbiE
MKILRKAVILEDKVKRAAMRMAAKLGFCRYREILEGPTTDMTNDRFTKAFVRLYIEPENRAVRKWMESGRGKTYLDIGAGDGRFTEIALDSGATNIVAVDINPNCIEMLKSRFSEDRKVRIMQEDARNMRFEDDSFDRVICLGNTLGNMFETYPGGEKSFQADVLREMFRVAKEEVVLTLHRDHLLGIRLMLQYYRMNGFELYGYEAGIARLRKRIGPERKGMEHKSQKFSKEDIFAITDQAGIQREKVTIGPINVCNWIVYIRKTISSS